MVPTLRGMAAALGVAALAACASPFEPGAGPEGVRMTVDRGRYAPGDTVSARLENGSEVTLGYNLCFSTLERREASGWDVADEPLMICTQELRHLAPGESVAHRRELPARLESGRYRLQVFVYFPLENGSRVPVHSEAFEVER